jgi:hypothetical protein
MIRGMSVAALLVLAVLPARALTECPFEPFQRDEIIDAITRAADCRASFDVLSVCQTNAGGDVELAAIVTERCEKTFLEALSSDRKLAYERAQKACDQKYAKASGTMYASAQAICRASVAVRFAK